MHSALVNHKREVLLENKKQSVVLAEELDHITEQREGVEGAKNELLTEVTTVRCYFKSAIIVLLIFTSTTARSPS